MGFYLVDDIEQGTAKWLQWRKGVIGASEAAIIMGENRWKGRQQLMDEKRGLIEPFKGNDATREGNLNEPHARAALERKYKEKLAPTIVQDIQEPFLAASLDAINGSRDQIYEIKCGARTYETVEISRKIPSYYVAQVQHMLMVTQMDSLIFAAYRPHLPLISFEVFRNDSYIRELRRKEKDFIRELEGYGHKIQYEFRGHQVGRGPKNSETARRRASRKTNKPEWINENGLLRFWDGSDYLEGQGPGLYELLGENHYWNGAEWCLPELPGFYILNGDEYYWNGSTWD
jgi:putative phage-type endonuclease